MDGQHQEGHERVQDDGRDGRISKCVAHEDKGRPIIGGIGEKQEHKSATCWLHIFICHSLMRQDFMYLSLENDVMHISSVTATRVIFLNPNRSALQLLHISTVDIPFAPLQSSTVRP